MTNRTQDDMLSDLLSRAALSTSVFARPFRAAGLRAIEEGVRAGDPQAGYRLARVACETSDQTMRDRARAVLAVGIPTEAAAGVATYWAVSRSPSLESCVLLAGVLPEQPPGAFVAVALFTRQPERLTPRSAEVASLLLDSLSDSDPRHRNAARRSLPYLRGAEAMRELSRFVVASDDTEAVAAAVSALREARDGDDTDAVAGIWAETRHPILRSLVLEGRWISSGPPAVRLLSGLLCGAHAREIGVGPDLVSILRETCEDSDPGLSGGARNLLGRLSDRDARELVCRLAVEEGDEILLEAATRGRYLPVDPHRAAEYLFLTDQWDRYDKLDPDRSLLRTVYQTATPEVQARLTHTIRDSGRSDLLPVLVGIDFMSAPGALTVEQTEFVIRSLSEDRKWDQLWYLAFETSPPTSAKIVRLLSDAGWAPAGPAESETMAHLDGLARRGAMELGDGDLGLPLAVERARVTVHGSVNALSFAPSEMKVAIGTAQRVALIWDYHGARSTRLRGRLTRSIGHIVYGQSGDLLCGERSNGRSCAVHRWSPEREAWTRLEDFVGSVTALEATTGGRFLVTDRGGSAYVLEVTEGGHRRVASRELGFWAREARISPAGDTALFLHEGATLARLADLRGTARTSPRLAAGITKNAAYVDEERMILGKFNGDVLAVRLRAASLTLERGVVTRHSSRVQGVEVLTHRGVVITAGAEGAINFTSVDGNQAIGSIRGLGALRSLHVSPDEMFMAVGHTDHEMSFWDLRVMDVPMLMRTPLSNTTPNMLGAVTAAKDAMASATDQSGPALEYLQIALRHRFRHAVSIDEVRGIKPGQFDVGLE